MGVGRVTLCCGRFCVWVGFTFVTGTSHRRHNHCSSDTCVPPPPRPPPQRCRMYLQRRRCVQHWWCCPTRPGAPIPHAKQDLFVPSLLVKSARTSCTHLAGRQAGASVLMPCPCRLAVTCRWLYGAGLIHCIAAAGSVLLAALSWVPGHMHVSGCSGVGDDGGQSNPAPYCGALALLAAWRRIQRPHAMQWLGKQPPFINA